MHVISQRGSLSHFQYRPADLAPFTSLDHDFHDFFDEPQCLKHLAGLNEPALPFLQRMSLLSQASPLFLELT